MPPLVSTKVVSAFQSVYHYRILSYLMHSMVCKCNFHSTVNSVEDFNIFLPVMLHSLSAVPALLHTAIVITHSVLQ